MWKPLYSYLSNSLYLRTIEKCKWSSTHWSRIFFTTGSIDIHRVADYCGIFKGVFPPLMAWKCLLYCNCLFKLQLNQLWVSFNINSMFRGMVSLVAALIASWRLWQMHLIKIKLTRPNSSFNNLKTPLLMPTSVAALSLAMAIKFLKLSLYGDQTTLIKIKMNNLV